MPVPVKSFISVKLSSIFRYGTTPKPGLEGATPSWKLVLINTMGGLLMEPPHLGDKPVLLGQDGNIFIEPPSSEAWRHIQPSKA
jgi:hypothetical protein